MNQHVAQAQRLDDWEPFRPVQYLGCKLRVLPEIQQAAASLVSSKPSVVDLFSGTSVVGQQLASTGARVTTVDTQLYAKLFGAALLGVGRNPGEPVPFAEIVREAHRKARASKSWRQACDLEQAALEKGDSLKLRELYDSIEVRRSLRDRGSQADICTVYAGSYFGVRQASEIDLLISTISDFWRDGELSEWQRAGALTGLMHAASRVVHSAGKHFAQPLRFRSENAGFLNSRLIQDRSLSVFDCFLEGCGRVSETPFDALSMHKSIKMPAEEFVQLCSPESAELFYLDPPYTAQQYSRFYHVLETIADGGRPDLPAGVQTAGLYPAGRYKSAFSSKRSASRQFAYIIDRIARLGASAIISYSLSALGSTGNARMVDWEVLIELCIRAFGSKKVDVVPMRHRYRQFNSAKSANAGRNDAEVLVLCRSV